MLGMLKLRINQQALRHVWLSGVNASDHNLLPEIRAYVAKARLRRGIELIRLANRIEALKLQEDASEVPGEGDVPTNARQAAGEALAAHDLKKGLSAAKQPAAGPVKGNRLSRAAKSAIFREVVLAKVREMKEQQERDKVEKSVTERAKGGAR